MKRLITMLTLLMFGLATVTQSVNASANFQHMTKSGKPDKRYNDSKHLKKDGTMDMRYNTSKKAASKVETQKKKPVKP